MSVRKYFDIAQKVTKASNLDEIGSGSYGTIFKIKDTHGKIWADKIVEKDDIDFNEIDILCKFQHPNITHAADFYFKDPNFHIILPIADMDLSKYSKQNNVINGKISLNEAILIMYQILSAVNFLHLQGYFHCDVKPENVLMFGSKPMLNDFGWTYQKEYDTEGICGTMTYVSPQCSKILNVNKESCNQILSDIFGLGTIFYQLLTGSKLITYYPNNEHNQRVSYNKSENKIHQSSIKNPILRQALDCISKMCKLKQDERISSVQAILNEPVFADKGLNSAIQGMVKVPKIPTYDSFAGLAGQRVFNLLLPWCLNVCAVFFKSYKIKVNLLQLCLIPGMILRALGKAKATVDLQRIGAAVCYIAAKVCGKDAAPIEKYSGLTNKAYNEEEVFDEVVSIVKYLEGCLTHPTIYNETDNVIECMWYLAHCLNNYDMIFKDPKQLHRVYDLMESSRPNLIKLRIKKDSDFTFIVDEKQKLIVVNKIKISYNSKSFFEIE